jgi:TRAP-type uncharacterized transport system fused permease subunit
MEQQRGSGIPIWAWIIIGVVIAVPCIAAVLIAVCGAHLFVHWLDWGASPAADPRLNLTP